MFKVLSTVYLGSFLNIHDPYIHTTGQKTQSQTFYLNKHIQIEAPILIPIQNRICFEHAQLLAQSSKTNPAPERKEKIYITTSN